MTPRYEMISASRHKINSIFIDFEFQIGYDKTQSVVSPYVSLVDEGVVGCTWLGGYGTYWLPWLPFWIRENITLNSI